MTDKHWQELMEGDPALIPNVLLIALATSAESPPPAPCVSFNMNASTSYPSHKSLTILVQEGGVGFINFLLAKVISSDDFSLLPAISWVREWHFHDILKFPKKVMEEWKMEYCEELESLCQCKVFELCNLPNGRKVVCNCWVFDVKPGHCKKAWLVAKGFSQKQGINYNKIFSPVVHFETMRMMLALSALEDWHIEALDVKTAFLYGKLDEEIYMEQPQGFRLKGPDAKKVLHFYVDDALFFGKNQRAIKKVKKTFMDIWECWDLSEAKEFLHMRIKCEGHKIYLDQTAYLTKVIECFGMSNARVATTPLLDGYNPTESKSTCSNKFWTEYQSIIGSLLYIMLGTCPDICYAITKLTQFSINPSKEHMDKAKYIICYLLSTSNYSLVFDGTSGKGLMAYVEDISNCNYLSIFIFLFSYFMTYDWESLSSETKVDIYSL